MNRRGFLQSCLALSAAPAIVRADSLMRIVPRDTGVITAYWGTNELRIFQDSWDVTVLPMPEEQLRQLWYRARDDLIRVVPEMPPALWVRQ